MFGLHSREHKTAIVTDVGSSSVGVALICVHGDGPVETIWSHREFCIIHEEATAAIQLKQIKTAITNAYLELHQMGLRALKDSGHSTRIDEVQMVVAAPWSFTISKTISLKDEKTFTVDDKLIAELVSAAKKQSELVLNTNKLTKTLGLRITHEDVLGVSINGYAVREPLEQEGKEISLSFAETAISEDVSATLINTVEKFFPNAKLTMYSFMYVFYLTMRNRHPNTSEVCLIDVTGEATEIGIVREDILQHTTFNPNGINSIARELSMLTGVTRQEAYSYMKDDPQTIAERLPAKFHDSIIETIEHYQEQVTNMFNRTGDMLSIPKTIFLHSDYYTESFFVYQLEAAAAKATTKKHRVHPITAEALGVKTEVDAGLLMSINFFAEREKYIRLLPKAE